ncbi:g10498 [Coccomyxa viridis]|uniref:lycopene beta-cyclase n=1 Tax=Coccomyxa viridis TaxID=1274662 RepID=A0ABP1GBI7_9CHLO
MHSSFQQGAVCGRSRRRGTGLQVQCVQALERPTQESRGEARQTAASARSQQREVPDSSIKTEDLVLPEFDRRTGEVELIVAGAGPSGLAVAERVSQAGFRVCIIDPAPLAHWPNNYGVWVDEFAAMGLDDCLDHIWDRAEVFLDSKAEDKKKLSRPYGRVDRARLKRKLLNKCIAQGVTFQLSKVERVQHQDGSSHVECSDGTQIQGRMVLDATGHARKLVEYDKPFDPGYQGAYGILCEVESHPFATDAMLFMDWRDNHTSSDPEMQESNRKLPTFLYAMPFSDTRLFLEETSLVARPAVPFEELKRRLDARLDHYGIKIKSIEEDEYCLIPMGGVLPRVPQRVLGIGGTAGMVHPSTGYMVSRMLGAVPVLADSIVEQLCKASDKASDSEQHLGAETEEDAAALSAAVWHSIWPVERIRQRAFFSFGMDVLLKLDLSETRQFFAAFFALSDFHWQGFLSARLSFIELIGFGLSLFRHASNEARLNLLVKGLPGLVGMLFGLLRTIGYEDRLLGKEERPQ